MTTTTEAEVTYRGRMKNPPPVGKVGDTEIRRITVTALDSMMARGRGTTPGEYSAIYRRGALWMSDTSAEYRDHSEAIWRLKYAKRVLINGLGLGLILDEALACENVEHVDVVEIDADVIALVGPHFAHDPRVTVHHADAYTIKWPPGTRWDMAWHDIWVNLCEDNLPLMAKLHRSYGRRVDWQGSWGKALIEAEKRRTRDAWWRR